MNERAIVILGSTGSIGQSTLEVVRDNPGSFKVVALAAHSNVEKLAEQYRQYRPDYVCLTDPDCFKHARTTFKKEPVELLCGEEEMVKLCALEGVDLVLNAVVGAAGLRASIETVKQGKLLALANKESLVAGGPLFGSLLEKTGAKILPVDSEHSAIWQALSAGRRKDLRSIILTASGGPFKDLPAEQFEHITPAQALEHPTWSMGAKITIDSATLANKGLEVIEAATLFSIPADQIKVVIHPQSIIHSMVEFVDSSIIAQLSLPDMRLPINYALFWPERKPSVYGRLDFGRLRELTFEEPDYRRFPALRLAYQVTEIGGTAPAVYNAANEVAVSSFLNEHIRFTEIAETIEEVVNQMEFAADPSLDDILEADRRARELAGKLIGNPTC